MSFPIRSFWSFAPAVLLALRNGAVARFLLGEFQKYILQIIRTCAERAVGR